MRHINRHIKKTIARRKLEQEREKLSDELQDALAKVKQLTGLVPVCTSCNKIRDDKVFWNQIEAYMLGRPDPEPAQGICPECLKNLHPENYEVQCWEYMKCGHEVAKTCPTVLLDAGRMCWNISSTLCGGKRQGEAFRKLRLCQDCEFFIKLNRGEI